ncbi:MAG: ZIP family metal transporter [Treponema sp.]|nr:ZIP family metal transporter [Treponema sp.]
MVSIAIGLLIPFIGTSLGAACVFFMNREMNDSLNRFLMGFAAGIMIAASVWSLLIPSMEMASSLGRISFLPALIGFLLGVAFLLLLDNVIPHLHALAKKPEGPHTKLSRTAMLVFAVTLHNIPEGMAVGVVLAGMISQNSLVTLGSAIALAVGIAIQNFPEGAIISMPLRTEGNSKIKSFSYGILSGIVEPVAGLITLILTSTILTFLPYILSFAAGAMVYVVVEELLPEATSDEKTNICTIGFAIGFALMMVLDVVLG